MDFNSKIFSNPRNSFCCIFQHFNFQKWDENNFAFILWKLSAFKLNTDVTMIDVKWHNWHREINKYLDAVSGFVLLMHFWVLLLPTWGFNYLLCFSNSQIYFPLFPKLLWLQDLGIVFLNSRIFEYCSKNKEQETLLIYIHVYIWVIYVWEWVSL